MRPARRHDDPGFNPLGRAAFLLVFLGELGGRWLLGQEDEAAWALPLLHGFFAWGGVLLFCLCVERLHARCVAPSAGRGE